MNQERLTELIAGYLEGGLRAEERRELLGLARAHREAAARLSGAVDAAILIDLALRDSDRFVGAVLARVAPGDRDGERRRELMARIEKAAGSRGRLPRFRRVLVAGGLVGLAAAVAAAAALVLGTARDHATPDGGRAPSAVDHDSAGPQPRMNGRGAIRRGDVSVSLEREERRADGVARETRPAPQAVGGDTESRVLLSFDFEDGARPQMLSNGEVAAGAPREGNKFCAMGAMNFYMARSVSITIRSSTRAGLLRHAPGLVVGFDYWMGRDGKSLTVQFRDVDKDENFAFIIVNPVYETWTHAELRLADFKPDHGVAQLADGDRLDNLSFMGGRFLGKPFFVDNIKVSDSGSP